MTSSPDLANLDFVSLELVSLDPGSGPAGGVGGRRQGVGAASPSWPLRPGSGAAAWRPVCAAGAAGTRSRCCHCPARYATAAEMEPADTDRRRRGGKEERVTGNQKMVKIRSETPPTVCYCC